jgi:glycosyltransferase involved in cell wall biosynthesis
MRPLISVVIPAHNEERYLPTTLEYLARQTYFPREVIVVANGCTDQTEAMAKDKCDRFIWLDSRSLGLARNLGGKKARGELLVFLDADTLLEPHALETIAAEFGRQFAMGTLRGRPDSKSIPHWLLYGLKNFLHRTSMHLGSAGVIVCWKDYFRLVGGFDETLHVSEVNDFMKKMKRYGKYKFIGSTSATTSMRRYQRMGTVRMVLLWIKIWLVSMFSDIRHRRYEPVR